MQITVLGGCVVPVDQFSHAARRVKGAGSLKHHAKLPPCLVESHDRVWRALPGPPVTLVFAAVPQEIPVQLADMVLGHINVAPRCEDCVHYLRVASDLLFVSVREGLNVEIGEQPLNFLIGEPASLNACRRAYALDGGDAA